MVLASTGGADRAGRQPWLPLLATLAAAAQAAVGAKYLFYQMPKVDKAWCPYLRTHLTRFGTQAPLFRALKEPRLVRVIGAVLADPAAPHTVQSLADAAGMSRSVFAKHFQESYGKTPLEFVQSARLRHGARMLATTELPISSITSCIGYSSRSHFSRAFRAAYGVDPTACRRMKSGSNGAEQPLFAEPLDAPAAPG
ncbi:MAG: AraC family transcriptional regulator, partial [Proteobacteria bacterium]|nr:AraC family transcriptional regulator [Pseudomonadota bacterium]